MALLMFREEVSSAPPVWTDLGALEEQSGTDLRWFARHIIVKLSLVPFSLSPVWTY